MGNLKKIRALQIGCNLLAVAGLELTDPLAAKP